MSQQFQLAHDTHNDAVSSQIRWYQAHQEYLYNYLESSAPYIYYIYSETKKRNLPAELALLPVIESQFNPYAHSHAGASGLWQLMPSTAHGLGIKITRSYDGRRDIVASTNAALDYLTSLHSFFNNWQLALAAYDCGEGKVIQTTRYTGKTNFWKLPLSRETRTYIPKLLALAAIIQNPARYHIQLPPISNTPYFTAIKVNKRINFASAAKTAGISVRILHNLNPGYTVAAADPQVSKTLLVPVSKAASLNANMNNISNMIASNVRYYLVKQHDTLSAIANRYHVTTAMLLAANALTNSVIHIHQRLSIPDNNTSNTELAAADTNDTSLTDVAVDTPSSTNSSRHSYKVNSGDNLSVIAERFGTTTASLKKYNNLTSNLLKPGQVLYLPHHNDTELT